MTEKLFKTCSSHSLNRTRGAKRESRHPSIKGKKDKGIEQEVYKNIFICAPLTLGAYLILGLNIPVIVFISFKKRGNSIL